MSFLDRFSEQIKIAGQPIGGGHTAYKMDSTAGLNNMRKTVGLGTCHCCDYFRPNGNSLLLIEETRLLERIEQIRTEYDYLNDQDKDKIVNACIRDRMVLKAYGAMLVLCRLAAKCSSAGNLIHNKQYDFWLVAGNIQSADEHRFFDNLKDSLRDKLKSVLGAVLLDDVDVLSSETLEMRLSGHANTP